MADAPANAAPAHIRDMAAPMQLLLRARDLDWVTLAVGRLDGRIHAFGMRPALPASLGAGGFARVLGSIVPDDVHPSHRETACAPC